MKIFMCSKNPLENLQAQNVVLVKMTEILLIWSASSLQESVGFWIPQVRSFFFQNYKDTFEIGHWLLQVSIKDIFYVSCIS